MIENYSFLTVVAKYTEIFYNFQSNFKNFLDELLPKYQISIILIVSIQKISCEIDYERRGHSSKLGFVPRIIPIGNCPLERIHV